MKLLAWIGGILVSIIFVVYIAAFTSFGNSMIKPIVEGKIKEQTKLDSKLNVFSLTMNKFEIALEINEKNNIFVNGTYSLFSQAFDVEYKVELDNLKTLKPLTKTQLQGKFHTDGTVKGDLALIKIDGVSDVAKSDTDYHVVLTDLNPTSIIAKVQDASLGSLLYIGSQKEFASAVINLDINFKNITPHKLDGDILLTTKEGKVNTKLLKKDFKLNLPKTDFDMNLQAKLKGDDIDYDYILSSNLAKITSNGKVVPEPLKTDLKYKVDIKELGLLRPITNAPLRGAFLTYGTVKGDKSSMKIDGKSDIGQSDTFYKINLSDFQPKKVLAGIKGAKLSKLLYTAGQPNFAKCDLDVAVELTSLDPKNLAGKVDINLANGLVNSKVMKKVYKVNLPKTSFNSNTHVDLKGKNIDYNMWFKSNLAIIGSSGKVVPDDMKMDLIYSLNIKELAMLKPITNAPLRGAFGLKGKVKGDKKHLKVEGKSGFASSDTSFEAVLKDFAPASLKAKIKNLKLAKVLYMVSQPHYTDGTFYLEADIKDARVGKLDGKIKTTIKDGLLDSKYLTKAYKFESKMPKTTFTLNTDTKLDKDFADTKLELDSTLADFNIKKARINLKDMSIKSDYVAKVPNLDKLYFATARHMRGNIKVEGDLKKAKDLDLTIYSKVAGGVVDAKLHNDDFVADLKSLQTLSVLHMLIYPEIFKSSINGKLNYNLAKKKGKFNGHLVDGKFTQNQMLTLIKQFAKVDLYAEKFKGDISADINKEKIKASLDLKSNTSAIKTKNTKLNTKTKAIDSTITVVANKSPITVRLTGKATSPKVSLDVEKLMKSKAGEAIEKEAIKLFKGLF